ncbi:unnamed protein product [Taenia asiatica]|uniref:LsmAD domain-containing protein n=1 Tax=Taenia asiatica TaxID=60517 RepID=A0A0R3WG95_TAEAS|nr:unnamed protein product [Taenia asiatica]
MYVSIAIASVDYMTFSDTYEGWNATELDQHEVGVSPSADSTPAGFTNITPTDTQGALEGTLQLFGGATQSSHFTPTSASANRDTWNEPRSPSKGRESFIGLGIWNDDDVEQLAVHFLATEREHSTSLEAAIERHLEGLRLDVVSSSRPLVPSAHSEEDVAERRQEESEDKNDHKEVEDKPNEKADGSLSSEVEANKNKETTPTSESVKVEDQPSEPKEPPTEAPKIPISTASGASPSLQPPSNGEVVEEVPRSVKEQVAIFSNLSLQKTHDAPKPGTVGAFEIDHSNQNNVSSNSTPPTLSMQAPRVTTVYKNASPQPFMSAETDLIKQADRKPAEHPPNQSDSTMFERPQPLDRPSEPSPQPKKFVFKAVTSTPPMTFCVPFGSSSQSVKSTESPVKAVSPSQYLGPGVIAQTSRPPMMIRLRRPGPEAPWGFAVFGSADYGCPPFISRAFKFARYVTTEMID